MESAALSASSISSSTLAASESASKSGSSASSAAGDAAGDMHAGLMHSELDCGGDCVLLMMPWIRSLVPVEILRERGAVSSSFAPSNDLEFGVVKSGLDRVGEAEAEGMTMASSGFAFFNSVMR